ncbi:unnamed protein product [Amoebophrya sp. A120]|nr:unnamed protein product [Amoebophrya sp. A120]|eukprot:GSA120T00010593001.1
MKSLDLVLEKLERDIRFLFQFLFEQNQFALDQDHAASSVVVTPSGGQQEPQHVLASSSGVVSGSGSSKAAARIGSSSRSCGGNDHSGSSLSAVAGTANTYADFSQDVRSWKQKNFAVQQNAPSGVAFSAGTSQAPQQQFHGQVVDDHTTAAQSAFNTSLAPQKFLLLRHLQSYRDKVLSVLLYAKLYEQAVLLFDLKVEQQWVDPVMHGLQQKILSYKNKHGVVLDKLRIRCDNAEGASASASPPSSGRSNNSSSLHINIAADCSVSLPSFLQHCATAGNNAAGKDNFSSGAMFSCTPAARGGATASGDIYDDENHSEEHHPAEESSFELHTEDKSLNATMNSTAKLVNNYSKTEMKPQMMNKMRIMNSSTKLPEFPSFLVSLLKQCALLDKKLRTEHLGNTTMSFDRHTSIAAADLRKEAAFFFQKAEKLELELQDLKARRLLVNGGGGAGASPTRAGAVLLSGIATTSASRSPHAGSGTTRNNTNQTTQRGGRFQPLSNSAKGLSQPPKNDEMQRELPLPPDTEGHLGRELSSGFDHLPDTMNQASTRENKFAAAIEKSELQQQIADLQQKNNELTVKSNNFRQANAVLEEKVDFVYQLKDAIEHSQGKLDSILQDTSLLAKVFRNCVEESKELKKCLLDLEVKFTQSEQEKSRLQEKNHKLEGDLAYQKALLFRITAAKLSGDQPQVRGRCSEQGS